MELLNGPATELLTDARWVYSAACSWHGPISAAGRTEPGQFGRGLPCCPFCGAVLFQVESAEEWWRGAREHDARGHTNYLALLTWLRDQKRCWGSLRLAAVDFMNATGREVRWDL